MAMMVFALLGILIIVGTIGAYLWIGVLGRVSRRIPLIGRTLGAMSAEWLGLY